MIDGLRPTDWLYPHFDHLTFVRGVLCLHFHLNPAHVASYDRPERLVLSFQWVRV